MDADDDVLGNAGNGFQNNDVAKVRCGNKPIMSESIF
jgi:hypothetical protein